MRRVATVCRYLTEEMIVEMIAEGRGSFREPRRRAIMCTCAPATAD